MGSSCFLYFLVVFSINSLSVSSSNSSANCTILRDDFAEAASFFTLCAVYNSRPITLCENCVDSYFNVLQSYENMSKFSDNGVTCIDYFVNLDRLQIVQSLYLDSYNLWNRAKCYECFEVVNGTLTHNKSKETKEFNKRHSVLMDCLNKTENGTICVTCFDNYIDLNSYYGSISNANEKIGVCMDIVDLMNNTWDFWNEKCCKYRRHDESIFLASASVIFVITILFYGLAQWCVEKKSPTIIQQPRFAESINNLSS